MPGFATKAREVHGSKYEYPEQEYLGNKVKITIVCPMHGAFLQKPNAHLMGRGCPECSNDLKRQRNKMLSDLVKEGLLARLQKVQPAWEYDIASFRGMAKKMQGVCKEHGTFFAAPNNLLNNSGCVGCGAKKHAAHMAARMLTTEEWVASAKEIHGDKYDYSASVYTGDKRPVEVRCKKHGKFKTDNDHRYRAAGCPRCSHHQSSGEASIAAYLTMFTSVVSRDRTIIKPKELDIYLPEKALAIEYCGMYWHSHADAPSEKADKHKHYQKYKDCAAAGIRLLTVFESDWEARKRAIKRLLRNAVGKGRGRLMARKCSLGKPSNADAREFYERYHPQGGAGSGEHYGLYWGGKLVACMRFALGHNDRGSAAKNRVWTLARYATRVNVAGGASRLFTAFLKDANPQEVKSFSDNRYFDGGMYAQLGFTLDEETAPDYQVWSAKLGLLPKTHYQRRVIQKRLNEHDVAANFDADTDTRTEAEMTYLMGARRIYDCGKKRWVWLAR
jgi:predicted  nucleic acid-binding Zn-ribbon protein